MSKLMWRGRDVEQMTKQDLKEALLELGEIYQQDIKMTSNYAINANRPDIKTATEVFNSSDMFLQDARRYYYEKGYREGYNKCNERAYDANLFSIEVIEEWFERYARGSYDTTKFEKELKQVREDLDDKDRDGISHNGERK